MNTFDITAYADRLGLPARPAGVEGLARLQEAQIRSIPFENIDAFLGRDPGTDLFAAADKILRGRRGGWCFELNALLHAALQAFGYSVERRLARVRMGRDAGGPRTHVALSCTIAGERWLADAGFGGPAPLTPLRLDTDDVQTAPNGEFAVRTDNMTGERVVLRQGIETGFSLYGLDEAHVTDADIVAASFVCSRWPGSPFPAHLMVNGYDGETRIGMFDKTVTLESADRQEKIELTGAGALGDVLCGRLSLDIDRETLDALWSRIAAG